MNITLGPGTAITNSAVAAKTKTVLMGGTISVEYLRNIAEVLARRPEVAEIDSLVAESGAPGLSEVERPTSRVARPRSSPTCSMTGKSNYHDNTITQCASNAPALLVSGLTRMFGNIIHDPDIVYNVTYKVLGRNPMRGRV